MLYRNKTNDEYIKKSFLGGIFYYKKSIKTYEKEFRVIGLPIWKKKIKQGYEKFYLFGITYYFKKSRNLLYTSILKELNDNYKHIYINFNCSGETYLFLSYLNPPKDSVFVATKKYHIDLCHMMHPEIDCVYLPNVINLRSFDNVYAEQYDGKNFYNVLPFEHFIKLEKKLRKGEDIHYCKEICKTMGVDYSTIAKFPIISEDVKISAIEKAKRINLNLNNFIFITPESQSNEDPQNGFWQNKIDEFYNNGFDVFLNTINLNPKYGTAKTCFLTFEEAYYIASLSKEIIGLRSGFIEPLTSIQNVPITCYYTSFKDRGKLKALPAEIVLKGFTLSPLPNMSIYNLNEIVYREK